MTKKIFPFLANWFVYIFLSLVVVSGIIVSTMLINYLRDQEINRVHLFAEAQKLLNNSDSQDPEVQMMMLTILNDNNSIPVVVLDQQNHPVFMKNIPEKVEKDALRMQKLLQHMKASYQPIEIDLPEGKNQFIYYSNSDLLTKLRYYPVILGLIIAAYILFSFWFLHAIKKSSEGFLWAGLAKETAHQIGTPLSSMIGWLEILRMENENSTGVAEIEKDIQRLRVISERFSKIGSVPELSDLNLKETVVQNFDYLKSRISRKVNFSLTVPSNEILVPHSRILLSWVIENIVKNAVDAMKGQGQLEVVLHEKENSLIIDFTDTGSGMTKKQSRNAFKPGFSTKKRGWGLGLSLSKRVIREYHHGDIKIQQTKIGRGTTFRIVLPKNNRIL